MKKIIILIILFLNVLAASGKLSEAEWAKLKENCNLTKQQAFLLDSLYDKKKDNEITLLLSEIIMTKNQEIDSLKDNCLRFNGQEKNLLYLTEKGDIFTSPLPDSTEVSPAFRPLIRAISEVQEYDGAIKEMNNLLTEKRKEQSTKENRNKTWADLLSSDDVQNCLQNLINKNNKIEIIDLSIFSKDQKGYIENLQNQYNTIIIENFL